MKYIDLTQGEVAVVDDADYDMISKYSWHLDRSKTTMYAKSNSRGVNGESCNRIRMHRLIMGNPEGMCIDHRNGNGLDNRRCNLRICTQAENCRNQTKTKKGTSIYKGVLKRKENLTKPWVASISVNKTLVHLGYYKTENEAAVAYNLAALFHFKEFSSLNIIELQARPQDQSEAPE